MTLLLKLLIAHFVGDFFLQPESWVKEKEKNKLKSPKLYIHIAIHVVLMFIIVWDVSMWPLILTLGIFHFIIDALKLVLQQKNTKRFLFFIDQLLHIATIVMAYLIVSNSNLKLNVYVTENNLLLVTCLLFLSIPTSIIMKTIFTKWDIEELTKDNKSLDDAGKYIGILERFLVFIFIIVGHWEAVGFLITAKSVFRFGDLKESKHRKLTEYVLIGTLISFGIAIITGLIYLNLI